MEYGIYQVPRNCRWVFRPEPRIKQGSTLQCLGVRVGLNTTANCITISASLRWVYYATALIKFLTAQAGGSESIMLFYDGYGLSDTAQLELCIKNQLDEEWIKKKSRLPREYKIKLEFGSTALGTALCARARKYGFELDSSEACLYDGCRHTL